jgi:hypothetical protein
MDRKKIAGAAEVELPIQTTSTLTLPTYTGYYSELTNDIDVML